jgi:hypothetical protein
MNQQQSIEAERFALNWIQGKTEIKFTCFKLHADYRSKVLPIQTLMSLHAA